MTVHPVRLFKHIFRNTNLFRILVMYTRTYLMIVKDLAR